MNTNDKILLLSLFEHWYLKANDDRADLIHLSFKNDEADEAKSYITKVLFEFSNGMLISDQLVDEAYEIVEMVG
jgi:hypothetical protein